MLKHLCEGKNSKQIGDLLHIDSRRVEKHRRNLLRKTKTNNPASLAVYAVRHGLVED
ncbi:MAG: response regulator transcription factor [Flavobacteriaceae bacterium]|nr:response regulator transcription factor [Flavobacteriaceae bacterium]